MKKIEHLNISFTQQCKKKPTTTHTQKLMIQLFSEIRLDKRNSKFRLVAPKIIVQKQFIQKYFHCCVIKYKYLPKPASENELT